MGKYNFPEKFRGAYSTRMELPDWFFNFSIDTLNRVKKLGILAGGVEVNTVGEYDEKEILDSGNFGEPATLDYDKVLAWAKQDIPLDQPDVVEWMVEATAAGAILMARAREYERAGSYMLTASDDANIPGVRVEDIYYRKERGTDVASRGYAVIITPQGNFNVPVPGKQTVITKNILAWGSVIRAYIVQWIGALIKWKDLAINPQSRIGFANTSGLVAPLFIGHQASRRAFRNIVEMSVTTNKSQTMRINFRSPTDYTVVYGSLNIPLREGQNVVKFKIRSLFGVPPMVVELQPEDRTNTALDYYKVYP